MDGKEKTTKTLEDCCGDSEGSFDCDAIMQKMKSIFASMSKKDGSFDCGAMMQKMCCGPAEEPEK